MEEGATRAAVLFRVSSTDKVSAVGNHAVWGKSHVAEATVESRARSCSAQLFLRSLVRATVLLVPEPAHLARTNRRTRAGTPQLVATYQSRLRCPHRSLRKVGTSPRAAATRQADLLMFRHRSELPILEAVIKCVYPSPLTSPSKRVLMQV